MVILRIKKDSKWRPLYLPEPQVRYILAYGPRLGGKSYRTSHSSIVRMTSGEYYRAYIMRNVLDSVRDSIFQDCQDRIEEMDLERHGVAIVESSLTIRYGKNEIKGKGFKKSSGKDTAKQKSLAGRNEVIIEEMEEIDKADYDQLDFSLRTVKGRVLVKGVFNPPVKGHWILDEWFELRPATYELVKEHCGVDISDIPEKSLDGFFVMVPKTDRPDTAYIFSNYHGNINNLDPTTIAKIDRVKESDPAYYLHQFVGLVPSGKTGLIFKNYKTLSVEEYEKLPYNKRYGLDFGSNDPTTLVEVMVHDKDIYIRTKFYLKNLTIDQIWELIKGIPEKIVGDGQAKQTIQTLNAKGECWVESSFKGADSVEAGIRKLLGFNIHICEDSVEGIEEANNYVWMTDKHGIPTDKPKDEFNHMWDAVRYAIEDIDSQFIYTENMFIV